MGLITSSTWNDLKTALDDLRERLPTMRQEHPDKGAFLRVFLREAQTIQAQVDHEEDLSHHVFVELNHMLVDCGFLSDAERQF